MADLQKSVDRDFKIALLFNVVGIMALFAYGTYLSSNNPLNDSEAKLFALASDGIKVLFGAFAGLLGGKAL